MPFSWVARATAMAWRWPPDSFAAGTSTEGIVDPDVVQVLTRGLAHRPVLEEAEPAATGVLPVEEKIVVDAQLVHQRQVLEDRLDAVMASFLDRAEPDLFALYVDATVVRLVEPGQDLDQSGLAGAVVADQAEDLAPAQVQVHAPQRGHGAEAHGDVFDPQDVVGVDSVLGLDLRTSLAHRHLSSSAEDRVRGNGQMTRARLL